jgi:uncharacterized protein
MALEFTPVISTIVIMVAAGLVQGVLGFGFPFVATPLIAMMSGMSTAVVTVLLPTIATVAIALFSAGSISQAIVRFGAMPFYSIVGSAIGTLLFVTFPAAPYTIILAAITLLYLNLDRFGKADWPFVRKHERFFAIPTGLAAGVFEGTANISAPVLVIFFLALRLPPAPMVQAMCMCFLVGKVTQLAILSTEGGVTSAQWLATVPFVIVSVLATMAGVRLRTRVDPLTFRRWVRRALLVIAVTLVADFLRVLWIQT